MKRFAATELSCSSFSIALLAFLMMLAQEIAFAGSRPPKAASTTSRVAGFRAAYNLSAYPDYQFPSATYWTAAGNAMAEKFTGAGAAAIWIVSLYLDNGFTQVGFPASSKSYPYLAFAPWDYSEAYLSHFDSTGLNIWLQIEPGAANVDTLIDLVLRRYGHHPCVVGFGIDVEWHQAHLHQHGQRITDAEAARWERRVRAHNPGYRLFLKHFAEAWMPPDYRGDILFVDDSQRFYSLASMVNEFKRWGERFFPNPVAFQLGYNADEIWWGEFADPPAEIGCVLLTAIPNVHALFWVDFTIMQVVPSRMSLLETKPPRTHCQPRDESSFLSRAEAPPQRGGITDDDAPVLHIDSTAAEKAMAEKIHPSFTLKQNYPLPSAPRTDITFIMPEQSRVKIEIYNASGELVYEVVDQEYKPGVYHAQWNGTNQARLPAPTGLYYYSMTTATRTLTKTLLLLR